MVRVDKVIEVNAPIQSVYQLWSRFDQFPRFMKYIDEVRMTGPDTSHWVAKTPLGKLEWNARTTEQTPNRHIAWNSTDGDINTSGIVTFEPSGAGTRVAVRLQYADPPGGKLAELTSSLFKVVENEVEGDLERFKELAEGERAAAR
jgi:uncharacterized membrane protein